MNPVELRAVAKTYRLGFLMNKRVRALGGLDLAIGEGQVYGLLGPNGAGKSTAIKLIMNLVQPSSGEVSLFGQPPSRPDARRQVGFLPENPAPYEYLTGRELVELAGRLYGMRGPELRRRVDEVLEAVGLGRAAALHIRRYSKGMTQRIGLAQAIVSRPRLLILDEPTSGMDPPGRRQIRELILAERARGTTVLFCTHIISDVEALCDRVAILIGGRRVKEGAVSELVSGQALDADVVLEGLDAGKVEALTPAPLAIQQRGGALVARVRRDGLDDFLRAALGAGGRVQEVRPASSLEQLFMDALAASPGGGAAVGGAIE